MTRLAQLGFFLFDTLVGLAALCAVVASVGAVVVAWAILVGG